MRLLTLLLIATGSFFPLQLQAETTKLKVGFIAALSGPAQAYGEAAKNGFELARSEARDSTIEVVYEDDQFIPSKTVAAFNKLVQVNAVDVVIGVGSATLNAIAPLAEAKHVPLISWASDPSGSINRRFVIRSYPSGQLEGERAGQEALARKFTDVGIVSAIHDYPISS